MSLRSAITTLGEIAGIGFIVYGVWQFSMPAGCIVLGIGMILFCMLSDLSPSPREEPAEAPETEAPQSLKPTLVDPETGLEVPQGPDLSDLGGIGIDRSTA